MSDAEAPTVNIPEILDPRRSPGPARGIAFIMSGPSGVGKDTITTALRDLGEEGLPLGFCVTATTRPPRDGETNALHYHFLSHEQFEALDAIGGFVEHAWVHGRTHRYGIPLEAMRKGLRTGNDVWVTPDVQGADVLRARLSDMVSIFLAPPDIEALIARLAERHKVDPNVLAARFRDPSSTDDLVKRLRGAEREMDRKGEFDYVVVNRQGRIDEAVAKVKAIITAERARVHPRTVTL